MMAVLFAGGNMQRDGRRFVRLFLTIIQWGQRPTSCPVAMRQSPHRHRTQEPDAISLLSVGASRNIMHNRSNDN